MTQNALFGCMLLQSGGYTICSEPTSKWHFSHRFAKPSCRLQCIIMAGDSVEGCDFLETPLLNGSSETGAETPARGCYMHTGRRAPSTTDPVMNRFQKGVAISVWQNSGDEDSNWARYSKSRWPFLSFGVSAIRGVHNVDINTDFWNRYASIERLQSTMFETHAWRLYNFI